MKRALDQRRAANWSAEAVARTQYHLAQILIRQNKELEKAQQLLGDAESVLKLLLPLDFPGSLKDVTDQSILYDHLLTVCAARFTGKGLLQHVR